MIKKLMSYIGEYKRDTLLSPISVTFEVILEVLLPMLMAKVIDNGVEAGNMNYVVKMGLLMLVVAMLSLAAGTLSGVFAARASMGFGKNLRKAMYDNIQDFSFQNIDHFCNPYDHRCDQRTECIPDADSYVCSCPDHDDLSTGNVCIHQSEDFPDLPDCTGILRRRDGIYRKPRISDL